MRTALDDPQILSKLRKIRKYTVPLTLPVSAPLETVATLDGLTLDFLKTGFAVGNYVLVDSGLQQSVYKLGAIPAAAEPIPVTRPVDFAHEAGALVKLLAELDLGYIEEGSATFSGSSSTTGVGAANAAGRIWQSDPDIGDLSCSWQQRAASPENIAAMYGMDESYVKGDGTTGDPYRVMVHPNTMGGQVEYAYHLTGYYKDRTTLNCLLLNPSPTITVNSAFGAKNAPMLCTVGCVYTHKLLWID